MFDLEQSISEWRKQMLAAGIKSPVPLEELESHLRDEIERQMKLGMDETKAFGAAVPKIGAAPAIQIEFEKIEKARKAVHLTRIYIFVMAVVIPLFFACMVLFKVGNFSQLTFAQQLSALASLAVFYLMIWCGKSSYTIFPAFRGRRMQKALPGLSMAALMFWWTILFYLILPHCEFDLSHLLLAILWGFVMPAGALVGLMQGIEIPARNKTAAAWAVTH
jgi:hypothetical protein